MALITRLSRLLAADVHAVLDRVEEPEALLKQAVREMEEAFAEDEQHIRRLQQDLERLHMRSGEVEKAVQQLDDELDTCFASNKDDLARNLMRRKLEAQRIQAVVASRIGEVQKALGQKEAERDENRTRLDSMKQKSELLGEQANDRRDYPNLDASGLRCTVSDDDVEIALLREKQRRAGR